MGSRRKARECALQLLYQHDIAQDVATGIPEEYWSETGAHGDVREFATRLFGGVSEHLQELDELISSHSAHWKMSRMAAVDKNILRMAAFELVHCPDIPVKVTINEAVEIAKRFGTAASGAFVNGILDNLAKAVRPAVDEEGGSR